MGKIRFSKLRRVVNDIMKKYRDRVSKDFEENKKFLNELGIFKSKTVRNIVAGMLVREIKKQEINS